MELEISTLENGITKVSLSGELDIDGALEIDDEFAEIAEANKNLVVDLSDVSFIASLGLRTLITAAKQTSSNGGKLVILKPQPNVEKVLRESRVDTLIPIIDDISAVDTVFVS